MKLISIIILFIIFIDQFSKIYVKTHFQYYENFEIFNSCYLTFIENPGMAYGIELGGGIYGKIILNFIRLILIIIISIYFYQSYKKNMSMHVIIPFSLIIAGSIGNLIDGVFYGIIFNKGLIFDPIHKNWVSYSGIAQINFQGYSGLFKGVVVDMFRISIFDGYLPNWIPILGGKKIEFFKYIFNFADLSITLGSIWLFIVKYKEKK